MIGCGIDIGGASLKGARVDLNSGCIIGPISVCKTPVPATPLAISEAIGEMRQELNASGAFGCGLPSVVLSGCAKTAANIDHAWIDFPVEKYLSDSHGVIVSVLNDADAAGLAEMRFGVGRELQGTTLMLTIGTGIGSALFKNDQLIPNTELGHLVVDGEEAEVLASGKTRQSLNLSFEEWVQRLNRVLAEYEALFWPDNIILGGGISSSFESYRHHIKSRAICQAAALRNEAGIVGAALWSALHAS